jgi:transcriptional regulator GlxA family with amidase domain
MVPRPKHFAAVEEKPMRALPCAVLLASCLPGAVPATAAPAPAPTGAAVEPAPLRPPSGRPVRVAFVISEGSNVIDSTGPWEVFQDARVRGRRAAFELYTVAARREPVRLTGGLRVVPDHPFADAPEPDVVVVPAIRASPELHAWLRRVAPHVDVLMSVCTGAFQLAAAGLLDGKAATTHHEFWDSFAARHPGVRLVRGNRFVEGGERIATAGGLTSGIDLALRVVERYYGRETALATARYMEYHSPYLK